VVFRAFYLREVAWNVPVNFDQTAYLLQSYKLQEQVLDHGLGVLPKVFWPSAGNGATGCALPLEGTMAALILGGTRFPRLLVNLLAFLGLQWFAFGTARQVGGSRAFGYAMVGLILAMHTPWFWAGGMFDFRIDFFATCLFGIWACAVLRSDIFLDRRWTIGAALLCAWLVLNRYLTLVYIVGICAALTVTLAVARWWFRGDAAVAWRLSRRLRHLAASVALLFLLVAPFLWAARLGIFHYYGGGHVLGGEKYVRMREMGISGLRDFLLFYPKSVVQEHLGKTFWWAAAASVAIALITRALNAGKSNQLQPATRRYSARLQIGFLSLAIAVPIAALTCDISKSPVVGDIVTVPVAMLLLLVMIRLGPTLAHATYLGVLRCGAVVVLLYGVGHFLDLGNRHLASFDHRADVARIVDLCQYTSHLARNQNWQQPRVSFDLISGDLHSGVLGCVGYETTGELVEYVTQLGRPIGRVERAEAMADLANSDFVILTTTPKQGVLPFYDGVREYEKDLVAWAQQNMVVARTFFFQGDKVTLYVRPTAPTAAIGGISGGWITSAGADLELIPGSLPKFPWIRIVGSNGFFRYLRHTPAVTATYEDSSGVHPLPTTATFGDPDYVIQIDASSAKGDADGGCRIHVAFDTFFVPRDVNINSDTRQLVVPAPTQVQLLRAKP